MTEASIPVDLYNPGQVFACLGFLEAADVLLGNAAGGFDWSDEAKARFLLRAQGEGSPFETVLAYLANAQVVDVEPEAWPGERSPGSVISETYPAALGDLWNSQEKKWTRTALPIEIVQGGIKVALSHWCDGSGRNPFKLYSGNRSALSIARAMILGTRAKPKKGKNIGDVETRGVAQLYEERRNELIDDPFGVLTAMGGSFNFDPRGAWTAIDAGYSPNDQGHSVEASPVVEIMAVWGLENARPDEFEARRISYAAWGVPLPPLLARVAISSGLTLVPLKRFRFELASSGKNKVVTFAESEIVS